MGPFLGIDGMIQQDLRRQGIHQAVAEAESGRAALFEVDGPVLSNVRSITGMWSSPFTTSSSLDAMRRAEDFA